MRKLNGDYTFKKEELWSLNCTLSKIIHDGLLQFRKMERHGDPGGLFIDGEWYVSVSQDDPRLNTEALEDYNGKVIEHHYISFGELTEIWGKILDDMILAFKITSEDTDGSGYLISISDNDGALKELYFLTESDKECVKNYMKSIHDVDPETKTIKPSSEFLLFRTVSDKVDDFILKNRENFARYMSHLWD